jgi:hypothetical protein
VKIEKPKWNKNFAEYSLKHKNIKGLTLIENDFKDCNDIVTNIIKKYPLIAINISILLI